ncbi:unnamed protein product [Rotaria socialis]|uniref:Caspase family p20 domain-containing protein n=1 Tax=Rotaria socialis TaxID=392032 RepID=A0A821RG25_9BILA|nr:unnamed protein product [Rotaria socialis]CAF4842782.1 unnamed protein product [Rotaria socialis]
MGNRFQNTNSEQISWPQSKNISLAQSEQTPRRFAIIIGNNKYENKKLENCVNDATELAASLESVNYKVTLQTNVTCDEMHQCIRDFTDSIQANDFIIFFFAGHGVQWGNQNYLLPCGCKKLDSRDDMERYAFNAQTILDTMVEKEPKCIVFLLDCCREYWLPKHKRGDAVDQGLTPMKLSTETLIAFACAAGETANDSSYGSKNGTFTKHLLENIKIPGLDVMKLMQRVTRGVKKETRNAQQPYLVSSITEDIYIVPAETIQATKSTPTIRKPLSANTHNQLTREKQSYESAADDSATSQLVPSKGSDEMAHSTSNASVKYKLATAAAFRRKRALVIGINEYARHRLRYCINDAKDLGEALQRIGFHVSSAYDCDRNDFNRSIASFAEGTSSDDLTLFYFCGTGFQYNDDLFLMPSNYDDPYNGPDPVYLKHNAISAQLIVEQITDRSCRVLILIYDSCRCYAQTKIRTRGVAETSKLTSMRSPTETIELFSCKPGMNASDTSVNGRNSIFMGTLLEYIDTPHLDIEEIFQMVTASVRTQTRGCQIPERRSDLTKVVYLAN